MTGSKAMSSDVDEARHLPMCIEPARPVARGRGQLWRRAAVLLVVLALAGFALRAGSMSRGPEVGPDLSLIGHDIERMVSTLERLPPRVGSAIASDVKTLARSIEGILVKVGRLPAPMVGPKAAHEIDFLGDLVQTIAAELDALRFDPRAREPELATIQHLTAAARAHLARLDAAVADRIEETRRSIITIEQRPDALLVKSIDRRIHDGVRAAGIMLFLIGLLVVGFRVLSGSRAGAEAEQLGNLMRGTVSPGASALALVMAGSFALAISPELVVSPSSAEVRPREAACQDLALQREQLRAAEALGSARLIAVVGQRVRDAVGDCLGEEQAVARVLGHDVQRALPPEGEASETSRVETGGAEAEATVGSELSRLMQAGHAQAAEVLDDPVQAPADRVVAAGRDASLPRSPAGSTRRQEGDAAVDLRSATRDPVPLPPEPAPRMPMPSDPAPREFVTTATVNYRAGPSRSAPRLGTLTDGTAVHMVDHARDWSIVRLGEGRSVYVASAYLERAE
jgi:hypothetical protein